MAGNPLLRHLSPSTENLYFQDGEGINFERFNRLLAVSPNLESLRIQSRTTGNGFTGTNFGIDQLRLPDSLRSFTLTYHPGWRHHETSILDATAVQANQAVYAGLRALHLNAKVPSLAPLSSFVNLVCLGVRLDSPAVDMNGEPLTGELTTALGNMPHLRVLLIEGWIEGSEILEGTLRALPAKCPRLEHLTTRRCHSAVMSAIGMLESLTSLHVNSEGYHAYKMEEGWDWLLPISERGRLEHLHIDGGLLPVKLGCTIIEQCKVGGVGAAVGVARFNA